MPDCTPVAWFPLTPKLLGRHCVYLCRLLPHFTNYPGNIIHSDCILYTLRVWFYLNDTAAVISCLINVFPWSRSLLFVLFPHLSPANDCHAALTAHGKQRDHPTKERWRDSALPIWIWFQEGCRHTSQQEVTSQGMFQKELLLLLPPARVSCDSLQTFRSSVCAKWDNSDRKSSHFWLLISLTFNMAEGSKKFHLRVCTARVSALMRAREAQVINLDCLPNNSISQCQDNISIIR